MAALTAGMSSRTLTSEISGLRRAREERISRAAFASILMSIRAVVEVSASYGALPAGDPGGALPAGVFVGAAARPEGVRAPKAQPHTRRRATAFRSFKRGWPRGRAPGPRSFPEARRDSGPPAARV